MLSQTIRPFFVVTLALATALAEAEPPDATPPPPPQAQLPPVPACQAVGRCRLSSSDDFAAEAAPEPLPECSPTHLPLPIACDATLTSPDAEVCRPRRVIGPLPQSVRDWRPFDNLRSAMLQAQFVTIKARERRPAGPTLAVGVQGCRTVSASTPTERPDPLTPIEHLEKAAEHLEAAGLPNEAAQIRQQALAMRHTMQRRLEELRSQQQRLQQEIEGLERAMRTGAQIELKVSLIEVDEAKLDQLGFRDNMLKNGFVIFDKSASSRSLPAHEAKAGLNALLSSDAARVLAEPTLVTRNGQEATIFSGGQFPILIPQPNGDIKVEHRECGVRLTATPHLLGDGRIRLDLAPQYSERDFTNAREVNGIKVPGITTRRVNTQVEMKLGETLILGGLRSTTQDVTAVGQMKLMVGNVIEQAGGGIHLILSSGSSGQRRPGKSFIVVATPRLVTSRDGHSMPTAQASPTPVGRSLPPMQQTSFVRVAPGPADECRLASGDVLGVFIETIVGEAGEEPPVHLSKDAGGEQAIGYPVEIGEDGTIDLPRIEPIQAAGLTLAELRTAVRRAYTIDRHLLRSKHDRIIVTLIKRHAE